MNLPPLCGFGVIHTFWASSLYEHPRQCVGGSRGALDGWLAGADGRFLRLMPRRPARARAVETKENREFSFAKSSAVHRRSAEPEHFDCFTRR